MFAAALMRDQENDEAEDTAHDFEGPSLDEVIPVIGEHGEELLMDVHALHYDEEHGFGCSCAYCGHVHGDSEGIFL